MKIKALIFFIAALLAAQNAYTQILKGSAPVFFEEKADMEAFTPSLPYGSELAFVLEDTTLYRWSRAADAWTKILTSEVYTIASAGDTSTISPAYEADVAYVADTLLFIRSSFAWLPFSGGSSGSTETADGLTILGDGTGGGPFRVDTTLLATRTYADSLFAVADSLREAGDRSTPILIQAFDRIIQLDGCSTSETVITGFQLIDDTPIDKGGVTFEIGSPQSITYDVYNADSTSYYFETSVSRAAGIYTWEVSYTDPDGNFVGDMNSFEVAPGTPDTVTVPLNDSVFVTRRCGVEIRRDTIDILPADNVTGTGTTNYLAKWTGANTQGPSIAYDNGTAVGINNGSPLYPLHVDFDETASTGGGIRIGTGEEQGGNHVSLLNLYDEITTDVSLLRGIHNEVDLTTRQSWNYLAQVNSTRFTGTNTYTQDGTSAYPWDVAGMVVQLEGDNPNVTLPNAVGFLAENPGFDGSGGSFAGTIDNYYGFYAETQDQATNNYGYYSEDNNRHRLGGKLAVGNGAVTANTLHVYGGTLQIDNTGGAAIARTNRTDGKITALVSGSTSSFFAFDDSGFFAVQAFPRATIEGTSFGTPSMLTVAGATGNVGIGTNTPRWSLDNAKTDGIIIGSGTTGQRGVNYLGGMRGNSTNTDIEWADGTNWWKIPKSATSSFTAGSAIFASATGGLTSSSTNLLQLDDTNDRIGIQAAPATGAGNHILQLRATQDYIMGVRDPGNTYYQYELEKVSGAVMRLRTSSTASMSLGSLPAGAGFGLTTNTGKFTFKENSGGPSSVSSWEVTSTYTAGTNINRSYWLFSENATFADTSGSEYRTLRLAPTLTNNSTIGQTTVQLSINASSGGTAPNNIGIKIDNSAGTGIYTTNSTVKNSFMGTLGIGVTPSSTTARLHLPAGTATASTAPLKFTSGTNLTTPEAGAVEWDGSRLYATQTSGPTRKTIAYTDDLADVVIDGGMTDNFLPRYDETSGTLVDSDIEDDGTTITAGFNRDEVEIIPLNSITMFVDNDSINIYGPVTRIGSTDNDTYVRVVDSSPTLVDAKAEEIHLTGEIYAPALSEYSGGGYYNIVQLPGTKEIRYDTVYTKIYGYLYGTLDSIALTGATDQTSITGWTEGGYNSGHFTATDSSLIYNGPTRRVEVQFDGKLIGGAAGDVEIRIGYSTSAGSGTLVLPADQTERITLTGGSTRDQFYTSCQMQLADGYEIKARGARGDFGIREARLRVMQID